ncbi:hypothetical protein SAMN04488556_4146 [Halostagnicola kamekurae]|uniref:Uncharacterized protein n=1 Tax=Halostagnicola kamekurae TaxID=619731 RepID=A0A1I6UWB4_9EURY|nr:hypothetical protein SAMN04488556_4146 [Halostagnicola kamekurae]
MVVLVERRKGSRRCIDYLCTVLEYFIDVMGVDIPPEIDQFCQMVRIQYFALDQRVSQESSTEEVLSLEEATEFVTDMTEVDR